MALQNSFGYELTSVNWFPEQTELWLYHVKKNCPQAYVTLSPDFEPIKDAWSSGKFTCLLSERQSPNLIYIDTDTIVFEDLAFIFDMMGNHKIGMINKTEQRNAYLISVKKGCSLSEKAAKRLGLNKVPCNRAGGMMVFKNFDNMVGFCEGWYNMHFNPAILAFKKNKKRWCSWQEIALSYWTAVWQRDTGNQVWDIPVEVHANLKVGRPMFDYENIKPSIIHYHTFPYLSKSPYSACFGDSRPYYHKIHCPKDSVKTRILMDKNH